MSLLNDMLRDLSQRQPVLDGAEGYDDKLLQTSSISSKKNYAWVNLCVFFVIVFIAVLGMSYAIKKLSSDQPGHTVSATKASNIKSQGESFSAPITAVATMPAVPKNEVAMVEQPPAEQAEDTVLQNHISDLLQQAERAMVMDRLTTPVEDNAYAYYQKILSMNAENDAAKEGLDKIAQRYLTKAQEQAQLGKPTQAEALLQRARFVSARFVDAHTVEFDESNQAAEAQATFQSTEAVSIAPAQTETIKPFSVAEAPSSVSVVPNAGWKDEQLARHAQELIQKGKQVEAQTLLKNFVASEQKPALSATLLTELYIQQENADAANIMLEQANYLAVDTKTKLKAQVLILQGDDAQAISALEKNLSEADVNESYRSLLASLYHKTGNYPQSILSYQRLINSFGEKPAYWLGLALAYDGLSQPKNALQAYLRLREFPQLQDQVKQYSDQRIATLRNQ